MDVQAIALVSDAGTPGVSDPGEKVISVAIRKGLPVIPIPGPTAAIVALTGSGLDARFFTFVGFLPEKEGSSDTSALDTRLISVPCRSLSEKTGRDRRYPDDSGSVRRAQRSRDDTKTECRDSGRAPSLLHCQGTDKNLRGAIASFFAPSETSVPLVQSFDRGTLAECLERATSVKEIKGEITVVIEGASRSSVDISDDVISSRLQLLLKHDAVPLSETVRRVSRELGIKKSRVYRLALTLKGDTYC